MPALPHVEYILDAARIAPSQGNMQPWRFIVEGDAVSFLVDHERDRSPANAGGRMARIGVGAALECALLRAGRMGVTVRFEAPRPGALITIRLSAAKRTPEPDKAVVRRATNRRLYDGRAVDDPTFAWLHEATPSVDGVRTLWFGRERVRTLGPIVEQGEAAFFAETVTREATLRTVRFDVRDREEVTHGLSLGSLELSPAERLTFDLLRHTSPDRPVATGAFQKMGSSMRRLVESASGVCVLTANGSDSSTDVSVGRCMQRAWLALTRRGLVAQPVTAIVELATILDLDEAAGVRLEDPQPAAGVVASFRSAFPSVERGSRIAFLMRFGRAPDPTSRVGRLPLEDSIAPEPLPGR
jgi:nitroreductase